LRGEEATKIAIAAMSKDSTISQNLLAAYEALHKVGIVEEKELKLLAAWIEDVEKML
jgi:hypothetical protein